MQQFWQKTAENIWTGRDDSTEGANARRMFQVVDILKEPIINFTHKNTLIGFACDEGVKRNKGREGASKAPDSLKQVFANFADQGAHTALVDLGSIVYKDSLEQTQSALATLVTEVQKADNRSIVIGGGHETAYAHGLGLYQAHLDKKIGIINFDAHLDMRQGTEATSGTPFRQLKEYCEEHQRPFHYLCIGVSEVGNTGSLLDTAKNSGTQIIWDYESHVGNLSSLIASIDAFIASVDIIYLSFDLDALPPGFMFAVSAPASLGVDPQVYLELGKHIKASGKLQAVDFVEYSPDKDRDNLCARVAARFIWEFTKNL